MNRNGGKRGYVEIGKLTEQRMGKWHLIGMLLTETITFCNHKSSITIYKNNCKLKTMGRLDNGIMEIWESVYT